MIDFRNISFSFLVLFFTTLSLSLEGQNGDQIIYQKVRVHLEGKDIRTVAALGVEVEHGYNRKKEELINFYSVDEVRQLKEAGFRVDILQEDAVAFYLEESKKVNPNELALQLRNNACFGDPLQYDVPGNFKFGSMNGYLTYAELLAELDKMRLKYPNLITSRIALTKSSQNVPLKTDEGRYLQYVKISDFPDVDERNTERQILYTGLHHAREPMSMMQMVYFMWYILEKYSTDPEVKYLLDKTELFFLPCVNPDGYIYNENQGKGGGLWRKNRDELAPVDINRNYGMGWGHDNDGSSPLKNSDTYRGGEPFSEPETKAVKFLFTENNFRIVVNYHSFGNQMIYPWGYSEINTDEHEIFLNFAQELTQHTDYGYGLNSETLGYPINGTADDWMYGQVNPNTKPKAYSFTFECGSAELSDSVSFWPLPNKIQPICANMIFQNLRSLWLLHGGIKVQSVSDRIILPNSNKATIKITRLGLMEDEVNIYIRPITSNVVNFNKDVVFEMPNLISETFDIPYQLVNNAKGEVKFEINYFFGTLLKKDTLTYTIRNYITRFENDGDKSAFTYQETVNSWVLDYDDYYNNEKSFTITTNEFYDKAENRTLETKNAIYIPESDSLAYLSFYSKWFIEKNIDYLKVFASSDGVFYEPLCGNYSQLGNIDQGEDDPVIDGYQPDWVNVLMDLTQFKGRSIYLKFVFRSDAKVNRTGVNIDAIRVIGVPGAPLANNEIENESKITIAPNPANNKFYIYREEGKNAKLTLYNTNGKQVLQKDIVNKIEEIDVNNLSSGLYIYKINEGNTNKAMTGKLVLVEK